MSKSKNKSKNTSNQRAVKKRQRANKKKGSLGIAKQHPSRTLRPGAKRHLERVLEKRKYIMPWVKDPYYKFGRHTYPENTFPGLPTELRQKILMYVLAPEEMDSLERKEIGLQIGALAAVSPQVRLDMQQYVGPKWKAEFEKVVFYQKFRQFRLDTGLTDKQFYPFARDGNEERKARKEQLGSLAKQFPGRMPRLPVHKYLGGRKPIEKGGKIGKWMRPMRCWCCRTRHFPTVECPSWFWDEVEELGGWEKATKPYRPGKQAKEKRYVFELDLHLRVEMLMFL